jgi:type I restriction enzyme, S subunit
MTPRTVRSLPQLLSFIVDNRGRTCPTSDSGIPLIATNCLKEGKREAVFENIRYVDENTHATWFRAHPKPGDILFVCKGSPGRVALVPDPVPYCIAQDMVALRADPAIVNANYLYYRLRSSDVRESIENMHVGTMIPHFKKGDFGKLKFTIHDDVSEQRAIAEFLGALDDKIAANERIHSLAEKLCSAEVQRASEGGYKRQLREVLKLHYGKALPASERVSGDVVVYGSGGITGMHSRPLVDHPGVIVGRKGTVGSVYWAGGPHFPIDTTYYVEPCETGTDEILYYVLQSAPLAELNSDSAVPGLNRDEAYSCQVTFPRKESLDALSRTLQDRFAWMKAVRDEIQVLTATRDELLPLLMSGKIRVRDAEKVVEEAV